MKTLICTLALLTLASIPACNAHPESSDGGAADQSMQQARLIAECRGAAQDCLKGALTVTDISACRDLFSACVGDAIDIVDEGLSEAIDIADEAIDITVDEATDLVGGLLPSNAVNAVNECRAGVTECLKGVASVSDVSECQEVFDACVGSAVSLVGIGIQIDLPGSAKPGSCSLGVSACLGQGKPPNQCAMDARICLSR